MHRVLIIADDLSGAADCGIACVHAGISAVVSLSAPRSMVEADVLALDADTRVMTSARAAQRMYDLTRQHAFDPSVILFKKIDSTLRGHLAPELVATLRARREAVPNAVAIMAPAFPAAGRMTHEGIHYLHGTPLHQSEMWQREKISGEAHIPSMLAGSGMQCGHIDLKTLRGNRGHLFQSIQSLITACDVIVLDAATADDLAAVAAVAASLGERALWVGSAGLAQHLVHACDLHPAGDSPSHELPTTHGPVLFVIGSASRTTKQQASALLAGSDIYGIVVPPEILLAGPGGADWSAFTAELEDAIRRGQDVILLCGSDPEVSPELRPSLSHSLGEMTADLHGRVGALVASGGETARKVLDRWGVHSMQLHGELEKGVPISSAMVDASKPLTVITKAGDFGQPYTLLHCREWLAQTRAE
jgi:uncharacterized protein YgbK (DUF1537 family)